MAAWLMISLFGNKESNEMHQMKISGSGEIRGQHFSRFLVHTMSDLKVVSMVPVLHGSSESLMRVPHHRWGENQ
ncbi:hypothetical protein E2C01_058910 [Portunus trituberculatus]|uniref:Uncharacterized protein n=1 Tax=Portunus trituberculatus TaxID=210409 RepID=A0A5B7H4H5_PORTR|nr:hypothetical protein [Portunus trituberculatus]